MVWPILISVAVTPGVSLAAAVPPASASSATAMNDLSIDMFRSSSRLHGADETGHALRHDHHDHDEDGAVDRPGGGVREPVGQVRDQRDEGGAEDHPEEGPDATHDGPHQEVDREQDAEAVRRHEAGD